MRARNGFQRSAFGSALLAIACTGLAPHSATGADWGKLSTKLLQPVAIESQLPNSSTPMALASDRQGFLWVGTQNGLARWDGLRFQIFNSGAAANTLPDSQIETLHVDRRGRLWVGTLSAGLARYEPATGTFKRYGASDAGHSYAGVHAIADAGDDRLWVGAEGGLDELSPDTGRVRHVQATPALDTILASGVNVLATGKGELWIGSNQGLVRRDDKTGSLVAIRLKDGAQPSVRSLLVDSAGNAWVGTEGAGAFVVDNSGRSVRAVPGTLRKGLLGAGMRVRALLEPKPGEIWLGTYDDGVLSVDPVTLKSQKVRLGNGSLLYGDQNVRAMHRAPGGQVFIAANSAITRFDPRDGAFETLTGGEAPTAVLAERTPVTVAQDVRGKVWVGYISHGVDIIDTTSQTVVHIGPRIGGLPEAPVRHLSPTASGMLVATDSGLYRSDLSGARIERLAQPGRASDAPVMSILRDGGTVWLGSRDGLWAYRLSAGDRLQPEMGSLSAQLSDRRVQVIARDVEGDVWIGTSRGLNVFDPATSKVTALEPKAGKAPAPTGFISNVMQDSLGRIWVSSFGRGLFVARNAQAAKALQFRHIDVSDGLPNSNVDTVLEDARGVIWAGTDSGLARIDTKTMRVETLQLAQGVPVASFFYSAGVKSAADDLLFAGRGGLQVVHPSLYAADTVAPPLRITEIRERGRILPGNPFLSMKDGARLRLPPGGGGLEVGFAALDYGEPDRVAYAYRLVGATSAWTDVDSSRRLASFNNLAPGAYTLEIRASDLSGNWAPQIIRLPLSVAPAWDQTVWFHLVEVLAAVAFIVALVRWRTGSLTRRRRELEEQVEERTHALQAQKDVLEAQALQLAEARTRAEALAQSKSDFLANMSHEIRTPLNGVVAVADMLARANLPPKERGMAEIIRASGDTLERLLSDILDMARIESGKITIETAPFHVGDMLRAVAGLSQLKCDEKGIRLAMEVDPAIDHVVIGDMVRVRQVITNLLSNAVKFTDAGEVRLIAQRQADGRARFTVTDTGVGFAMADKSKVLSRFEQADSSITRRFGGTGLGLSICSNLAELMGGELDCSSAPGVGSRFWLELPLESTDDETAGDAAASVHAADDNGDRLRVLVADDHPTNRQVVKLMLDDIVDLTFVEDGSQAVQAFAQAPFDVILMDMQMPVMDGLTAVREIRLCEQAAGRPRTPAIMLTANALPEHVASAMAAGADLHLAKPFTAQGLFDAIQDALASQEQSVMAA